MVVVDLKEEVDDLAEKNSYCLLCKKVHFCYWICLASVESPSVWCQELCLKIYSNLFFTNISLSYQRTKYRIFCNKMLCIFKQKFYYIFISYNFFWNRLKSSSKAGLIYLLLVTYKSSSPCTSSLLLKLSEVIWNSETMFGCCAIYQKLNPLNASAALI